jgi:hypothetical protein
VVSWYKSIQYAGTNLYVYNGLAESCVSQYGRIEIWISLDVHISIETEEKERKLEMEGEGKKEKGERETERGINGFTEWEGGKEKGIEGREG